MAFPFRFSAYPSRFCSLSKTEHAPEYYIIIRIAHLGTQAPAGAAKSAAHLNKMHHASPNQMQLFTRTLDRCPLDEGWRYQFGVLQYLTTSPWPT
ncbi:hypothetical protein ACN42_g5199 [Penicillium freii]|uniref:Uncharacterized protein n=1 Tax=Penicillium freii TaxID=48697 RepID=A0A101MJV5_PENFR|nr:hypothetical protein ACN42_g5199 [Penicillium freii]